jgi:hypothetical protein
MTKRTRRTLRGGNSNKLVTFKFSVNFYSDNDPSVSARVEDYIRMITSWYTDRVEELDLSEFDNMRNVKLSYDPSTKLFEGVGVMVDGDMSSEEDIQTAIESRIDPDDDGNYAIIIEKNELDSPDYLLVSEEENEENEENSDYDNKYGIVGKLVSYTVSRDEKRALSAEAIAALPAFTPSLTDYPAGSNALLMKDMKEGDVIAFIKSSSGKINKSQGIVVYKANGKPTKAYKQIFKANSPKNPFTREPIRKEDIVLKRITYNQDGGKTTRKTTKKTNRRYCKKTRKASK